MSFAKEVWDTLSKIDVSDHIEKKEGLSYLSWAWAWGELKKHYPQATYEIYKEEGKPVFYFEDHSGFMCYVTVCIEDLCHEMWLPVMDYKNKAMKSEPYEYQVWNKYKKQYEAKRVEAATMFDVNKTIMRCLVKCIAMFGLGHYIYAGEDLPEKEMIEPPKDYAGDGSGLQPVSQDQLEIMINLYQQENSLGLWEMKENSGIEVWGTLRGALASKFGKGNKIQGMNKLNTLISEAETQIAQYTEDLKTHIFNDDPEGTKEMSDLPASVKKAICKDLTQEELMQLEKLKKKQN